VDTREVLSQPFFIRSAGEVGRPSVVSRPNVVPTHGGAAAHRVEDDSHDTDTSWQPVPRRKRRKLSPVATPWLATSLVGTARPIGTTAEPTLNKAQELGLGEYIAQDSALLKSVGWNRFVELKRGRPNLQVRGPVKDHPADHILTCLEQVGAPVNLSTAPWSQERQELTLKRGPHKSADEFADFLKEELVDFIQKGQWVVLPYSLIMQDPNLRLHLRISPMGVVPQRDRRPRIIVDYSFFQVNGETVRLAPNEAMQFGKALERLIQDIVEANPRYGPVYLMKVDIADGFYRVWVRAPDIVKLAVSIPTLDGDEPLLALPLVLPMGWTESPPWFCATTETCTDVANQRLQRGWKAPPH
jgi:hypothetical protein